VTRLNRYLAAAGLGTRREVEGYVRLGRVTVDGAVARDPALRVGPDTDVRVDGEAVRAPRAAAVVFHRAAGAPLELVHPPGLLPELPLPSERGGLELLLGDARLAERIADPRFPAPQLFDEHGRRVRLARVDLGDLPEGDWRPLAPREVEALRLSVRLPPR
jgi:hypothetical protein